MALRLSPLLVALALVLAAAPAASARDLKVGITADGLLFNGQPGEAHEAVAAWQRMGIDTVRLQVNWSRVAPAPDAPLMPVGFSPSNPQDPQYRWGDIDRVVGLLHESGIKPLLMLNGPPPLWASSNPALGNRRHQPLSWQFAAFAQATAARYANQVDEYILWNEPNLPLWLQPQASCTKPRKATRRRPAVPAVCRPVSPHVYRFMVRAAYPAIHAVDTTSKVLIGALAPAGANLKSRNANMRPLHFLRNFGCVNKKLLPVRTGGCEGFQPAIADGIAHHPHSTKHPPDEPYPRPDDAGLGSLATFERLVDQLQQRGRLIGTTTPLGLWLDEYAYQTNPPDKERGVSPGRQDRFLQQAAYLAWRSPRVQLLTQYLWRDEPAGGGKRYTGWQSGLFTPEGRPKPALAHFDDPFWIDFRRNVLWGQIRPGTSHDVSVQVREAGAATAWRQIARVTTAQDGTWSVTTPLVPFASYRAVWDGDHTTARHVATPPSADDGPGGTERSGGLLVERRTVSPTPGAPVPASFAGMSIEYSSVPDYIGVDGQLNPIFTRMVGDLERAGTGAPTLRFGGDSTERTWWNPDGQPRPAGIETDMSPTWLAQVAQWVGQTRTPLVMGLNMGLNDPRRTAQQAAGIQAALPPGSVRAFELGNEPDLYATPRTYRVRRNVLVRTQKRPTGYEYPQYREEANEFSRAIGAGAPGIPIAAGGFASAAWEESLDDFFEANPGIRQWGAHAYPLPTCDENVRRSRVLQFRRKLVAGGAYVPILTRMRDLTAVAAANGGTVRMSEMNSAICGGLGGVSDTFAAALWGADMLFGLADVGVRNVDFHTWTGSHYGPVDFDVQGGRRRAQVRPLFYAMLLFARATPDGSRFLPTGPNPAAGRLKTWATVDAKGVRRIVVINKDPDAGRKVILTVPKARSAAKVERLTAPTLNSRHKAKFAGQGYGKWTTDGVLRGKRRTERLGLRRGTFRLVVPPASAALVSVR